MTFTGKSATSLPSPQECEASEFVLDAWRIILAQTLDAKEAEWDAHCRLMQANYEAMQAKSEAVIAGLQARVAELDGTIKGMVAIRLGELKDGERGPQGERGERGETGDSGEDGEDGIDGLCGDRGAKGETGEPGPQGLPGIQGIAGERGERGEPGERGEAGPQGSQGLEGMPGEQGVPGEKGERGEKGEKGEQGEKGTQGERGEQGEKGSSGEQGVHGRDGERGEKGEPGPAGKDGKEGAPGRLKEVQTFVNGTVHYTGEVVTHNGSSYQARCDTAKAPPHDDWACIAAGGRHAVSPQIKGTYDEQKTYGYLEIVALNGSSFIAKIDEPGPCPGDGWQLIASAGKPGKPGMKGDRGEAGPKGEKGEAGLPAVHIVGWRIDRKRYHIYPVMSDSREGKPIEMRELFVQYNEES